MLLLANIGQKLGTPRTFQLVAGLDLYPILGRRCRPRTWTGSDPGSFVSDPGTCSSRSTDNNLNESVLRKFDSSRARLFVSWQTKREMFSETGGQFFSSHRSLQLTSTSTSAATLPSAPTHFSSFDVDEETSERTEINFESLSNSIVIHPIQKQLSKQLRNSLRSLQCNKASLQVSAPWPGGSAVRVTWV